MSVMIALSGIDGSGKSTYAKCIHSMFSNRGIESVILDGMQHGLLAETLKCMSINNNVDFRECFSPSTINLAWTADLLYNYENQLIKYLNNEISVISHRSDLCCRVYSKLFSEDSDIIDSILDDFKFKYDFHFFFDVTPDIAYERIQNRKNKKLMEKEKLDMLHKADALYRRYLTTPMYENVKIINAEMTESEVCTVIEQILFK